MAVTRRWLLGAIALAPVACVPGTERFRAKVTIRIDTPEGLRSGAAVVETVRGGKIPWLPGGQYYNYSTYGSAIYVKLPGGDLIARFSPLALMKSATGLKLLPVELEQKLHENDPAEIKYANAQTAAITIGLSDLGQRSATNLRNYISSNLMRASSEADARTAMRYYGENPRFFHHVSDRTVEIASDNAKKRPVTLDVVDIMNLTERFGAGTRFRNITIEATNDEVT